MKKTKDRERQGAFTGAALTNEAENFAGLDFERDVTQDSGFAAIVHGELEREKRGNVFHLCAPREGSGPRRRTSAFQKAWGSRTEGAEPMTAGEMADMASRLMR